MRTLPILSGSVLSLLLAASACTVESDGSDGEVAATESAVFTGIRVPGLVLGLQHNQNAVGPENTMYSGIEPEVLQRRGGDLGAARHRGFEWWQLPDIGGDPAALRLPPGVVVALKHSANQASVAITSFGRNPVNGADFPGFKRQNGGDLGASNGVGYYWYESTGAGFTNWAAVDAMLPKYTVIGLKHALNQPTKVLVWNGVTYDPAKSAAAPPGFRRVVGGDRRDDGNEGYYWFEKITGEEIVTMPNLTHALSRSLFVPPGPVLDKDGDLLDDFQEAALAARFRPHVTFDSDETARRDGEHQEPVTVWRMYPTSPSTVHIRWVFLFEMDGGYGPESWCGDDHPGDNDAVDYDLMTTDGGRTWRLYKIDLSFKGLTWPSNSRLEVFQKYHPKFYFSASKHHEYFNRDNDEFVSRYSEHGCEDDVNGAGKQVLVATASFPGLTSNNVGEPNRITGFVNDIGAHFPNHQIWRPNDCFVVTDPPDFEPPTCGTNLSKFDGSDSLMPPPADVGTAPKASGFVWSGFLSGTATVPAHASYSFNSWNQTNTITPTGTGTYRVDFPGLGFETGGNVQVTAYGSGADRCKVSSWSSWSGTLSANVACFNSAGAAVNTPFTAAYVRRSGTSASQPGGYVWANSPSSASYTPNSTYQWNSSGAQNTIDRWGTGSYSVTFPGIYVNGGTVEVTAYGGGNAHCKTHGWGGNSVSVGCYSPSGQPVDSMFTLNFTEKSPHGTPSYAYAWAEQPATASYPPSSFYQRNTRSCAGLPAITMQRVSTGLYTATIPGLKSTGSSVHVTAYSGTSEACKVVNWGGAIGGGSSVNVACHNSAGQPADSLFVLTYSSVDVTGAELSNVRALRGGGRKATAPLPIPGDGGPGSLSVRLTSTTTFRQRVPACDRGGAHVGWVA